MPSWYPGQVAIGSKVFADPVIFTQTPSFQKSISTGPVPVVTTPATVASAGTVFNTTGYDVQVYASATTGIGKAVITPGGTAPGSTVSPSNQAVDFYLPTNAGIVLTYTGTLTWLWLAV